MIQALILLCCLLLATVVAMSFMKDRQKYKDFVGPSPLLSLPIFGHMLLLNMSDPMTALSNMRRKYGDIFRCDIGGTPTVFLCSYDLVDEAYKKDVFNDRAGPTRTFVKSIHLVS